eukprot:757710-Hanusia_phi.AAC.1
MPPPHPTFVVPPDLVTYSASCTPTLSTSPGNPLQIHVPPRIPPSPPKRHCDHPPLPLDPGKGYPTSTPANAR